MDAPTTSRRRLLAGAGAALASALAGCSVFGGPDYTLKSDPEDGADPVDLFEWRPASHAFHYEETDAERLADELRETGTVESIEIPLLEERGTGEEGYLPSYTEHDGTYSRVRVESAPVTLDRWVVWMEPLEELPEGVDATTDPEAGLSGRDVEIVREVTSEAVRSVISDRDHAAQPPTDRGVVFFEPLDPAESDLVPEPPFEYAVIDPETEFRSEELPVRLRVAEEPVETRRYVHDLEPVATSREAFVEHVRAEHVAVEYSSGELSSEVREILDESTTLTGHREEAPPSEAFGSILEDLGLADVEVPDGREVASWRRFYAVDDAYYSARLRISEI